jgi:hypothetical protein
MGKPHFWAVGTLIIAASNAACLGAQAHSRRATPTIIPIHDGRNAIDILGGGQPGIVEVADRENFNAHGHHVAMFEVDARQYPNDPNSRVVWQVVPFFGSGRDSVSGDEVFRTVEGADCTLRDLRIVRRSPGEPITVVAAERELGRSFADSARVRFDYFELRVNTDGLVGYPSYYFMRTRTVPGKGLYCDVDDAFDRELGLGRAGVLEWTGPR